MLGLRRSGFVLRSTASIATVRDSAPFKMQRSTIASSSTLVSSFLVGTKSTASRAVTALPRSGQSFATTSRSSASTTADAPSTTSSPALRTKHKRSRPLPVRKQLLYSAHHHLLTSNELVLFLRQTDFSSQEYSQLRTQLSSLTYPKDPNQEEGMKLTILRPGLLPALLRDPEFSRLVDVSSLQRSDHQKGSLSVLTAPKLDPTSLKKVLKLVSTFSNSQSRNAPPPDPKKKDLVKEERLKVLSALAEKRSFEADRVQALGDLPSLDTLRAQLVGLLSAPGARIVGVLSARGNELARTLEGYKVGLEEKKQGTEKSV